MRRQGAPKTIRSHPGDYVVLWSAERRGDYSKQGETPLRDLVRRPNLVRDSILRFTHNDLASAASAGPYYSIADKYRQLCGPKAVSRLGLKRVESDY
jgi:hypothetical protein